MLVGQDVKVQGELKFEGLLRIDGSVDGLIIAPKEVLLLNTYWPGRYNSCVIGVAIFLFIPKIGPYCYF